MVCVTIAYSLAARAVYTCTILLLERKIVLMKKLEEYEELYVTGAFGRMPMLVYLLSTTHAIFKPQLYTAVLYCFEQVFSSPAKCLHSCYSVHSKNSTTLYPVLSDLHAIRARESNQLGIKYKSINTGEQS